MSVTKINRGSRSRGAQRGAVLILSMIILLVMTLLGLSAMQSSMLEEQMAGNARDFNLAFQSAEAALRDAEAVILNVAAEPIASPTGLSANDAEPVWVKNAPDPEATNGAAWWCESARDQTWWEDKTEEYSEGAGALGHVALPHWLVEENDFVKDSLTVGTQQDEAGKVYYRVSARGTGGSGQALALVQSSYAKRF